MGFTAKWGKCAGDYGESTGGQGLGKSESLSMFLRWVRPGRAVVENGNRFIYRWKI